MEPVLLYKATTSLLWPLSVVLDDPFYIQYYLHSKTTCLMQPVVLIPETGQVPGTCNSIRGKTQILYSFSCPPPSLEFNYTCVIKPVQCTPYPQVPQFHVYIMAMIKTDMYMYINFYTACCRKRKPSEKEEEEPQEGSGVES